MLHVADGNISTLKAKINVDTAEVDESVQEQIESMAKKHAGKGNNTNPYIAFVVKEIE